MCDLESVPLSSTAPVRLRHHVESLFPTEWLKERDNPPPVLTGKDLLRMRDNQILQNGMYAGLDELKLFYKIKGSDDKYSMDAEAQANVGQWLFPDSLHCKNMTTMIRSMSLLGMSKQARALSDFLKEIVAPDVAHVPLVWQDMISKWDDALRAPIPVGTQAGRMKSFLFPEKSTAVEIIPIDCDRAHAADDTKRGLFNEQKALFDAAGIGNSERPLLAHFSSPETIVYYKENRHLAELVSSVASDVDVKLVEGFYFKEAHTAGQCNRAIRPPDADSVDVHVDFANTCFGGGWKNARNFAQEEIAFVENVGLAAVAQQASRFAGASTSVFPEAVKGVDDMLTVTHDRFGKAFPTRIADRANPGNYGAPAPIVIENAVRIANFPKYDGSARDLSAGRAKTALEAVNPVSTNWLAIAAPDMRGSTRDVRSQDASTALFTVAHAGFTAARDVACGRAVKIHTGKLGCGVFRNDVLMATAAQILAAKILGIEDISFHGYEKDVSTGVGESAAFGFAKNAVMELFNDASNTSPPVTVADLVGRVWGRLNSFDRD